MKCKSRRRSLGKHQSRKTVSIILVLRLNGKAQPPLRAAENGQMHPILCAQRSAAARVGRVKDGSTSPRLTLHIGHQTRLR
jgi:hypothetical protein